MSCSSDQDGRDVHTLFHLGNALQAAEKFEVWKHLKNPRDQLNYELFVLAEEMGCVTHGDPGVVSEDQGEVSVLSRESSSQKLSSIYGQTRPEGAERKL